MARRSTIIADVPNMIRAMLRLGPANPIALRLIYGGSRRVRHLTVRTAYLGALILVLLWVLLANAGGESLDYRQLASAGSRAFTAVAYLQIGLICVLAPVFMAGALAQESSPKTWDVLLTTPISPAQVVLGNLLGRLYFIIALLIATLPLFALTQYFGGVPGTSVLGSTLIAACAALLVGTIAVALSVSRVVGRRAVFAFYIAVVSYIAVTIGVDVYLRGAGLGAGGRGVTVLTAFNPFLALQALLSPSDYPRAVFDDPELGLLQRWLLARPVLCWCAGSAILSAVLAAGSALTVRLGGLGTLVQGRSAIPWYRRMFGLGGSGTEHRPPRTVGANPIAWREASARNATLGKIVARWSFIGVGLLFGVGLIAMHHAGLMTAESFRLALQTTVLAEMVVTVLLAINMSATAVTREREDGTLDLLLTTPLTPTMYLSGKLRGLVAYVLPMLAVPVVTIGLAGVWTFVTGQTVSARVGQSTLDLPLVLPEAGVVLGLVGVPFLAMCIMVGLLWSLRSKGTIGAVVATVAVVGTVAMITGLCGWLSGEDLAVLGAAAAGASPASVVRTLVDPAAGLRESIESSGLSTARLALGTGTIVFGAVYLGIVWAVRAGMVRNFDFTVRKLAGTR